MAKAKAQGKMIANNKKAYHDYFILDTYEAGIALAGTEVKSLRMGKCSIKESFIRIEDGEVFIYGMHISPYEKGNIFNKDPMWRISMWWWLPSACLSCFCLSIRRKIWNF